MIVKLQENTYFAYIKELEYLIALGGIFGDNLDGQLCRELCGEEFIQNIRRMNPEMTEIINTTKFGGYEFLEFLAEYREEFSLENYKKYILSLPLADYVYQFFGYEVEREEIEKGIAEEAYLSKLYYEGKFHVKSYINLKQIIFHREEIVEKYFSCVEQIRIPEIECYLEQCEKQVAILKEQIEQMLQTMTPQEIRDEIRKYSISNCKSACKIYCFLPSFLLPRNSLAFHNDQIYYIFYSNNRIKKQEEALKTLKVISDDTRLKIMDLLSERKTANGKTIARFLGIAPSTVSHHMEQLVDCNIVQEEKIGNAKMYSINKENAHGFVEQIKGVLLKNG